MGIQWISRSAVTLEIAKEQPVNATSQSCSHGENNSSHWKPVCLRSNTSHLTQRTWPGLDNLEGTQPVADTGWPVKFSSEHAEVGILERTRNV